MAANIHSHQRHAGKPRQHESWPRRAIRCLRLGISLPLLFAPGLSALAADIAVNDDCSLIDAISAANSDLATGGCPAGSGPDIITLPLNATITLSTPVVDVLGLPNVVTDITIIGNGATIERDDDAATPAFRIFTVNSAGTLRLENLTVRNGQSFTNRNGGGLEIAGNATLEGVTVVDNQALSENNTGGGAGGLSVLNTGVVLVVNSTFRGNRSKSGGAGINNRGRLTVRNSRFEQNEILQSGIGVGIANFFNATLIVEDSTFSGNFGGSQGGGIANLGTASIDGSTFDNNEVTAVGGGVRSQGTITISNSTFSGNTAGTTGGAIFATGTTDIVNSTLANNQSGEPGAGLGAFNAPSTYNVANTILFNPGGDDCDAQTVINDQGGNWFGDASCDGEADGDPLLERLGDYGGPTLTHSLQPASCAIDAALTSFCNEAPIGALDQRGEPRPAPGVNGGNRCDIGALEFQQFLAQTYDIEGTVSGLEGSLTLLLKDGNLGENFVVIDADGPFSSGAYPRDISYEWVVDTQPVGQRCVVENGAGTLSCGGVDNVVVTCATLSPQILTDGFEGS